MINYYHLPTCPCPLKDQHAFDYLFDSNDAVHISRPLDMLSETFIAWLNKFNIRPSFLEIFYLPANCTVRRIHTDLPEITDQASKINYIIGGEDASMQWFEPLSSGNNAVNYAPSDVRKGGESPFLFWSREECRVIDETILSGSNLIHAGIPHVVFTRESPRIAVSVVLTDKRTKKRLTCENVVERLKAII